MHDVAATNLIANSRQKSKGIVLESRSKEGLFEIRKMNEIECHFNNILGTQVRGLLCCRPWNINESCPQNFSIVYK